MVVVSSINDPQVESLLSSGAVGVLPTDTVYGLTAVATNENAVKRLYGLKQRDQKPGTCIAASVEQLQALDLDTSALQAVAYLWPNPISIVISLTRPRDYLDLGHGTLAVRIPADADLRALLEKTGPLLTSSANPPQEMVANTIQEAQNYFAQNVDFYVDGGDLSGHEPSTVARFTDGRLEVLRQGAVTIDKKDR